MVNGIRLRLFTEKTIEIKVCVKMCYLKLNLRT